MIKAEELRIGNWVKHNENVSASEFPGTVFQWTSAHWFDVERSHLNLASVDPIALTAEILEAVGFAFNENKSWSKMDLGKWCVGEDGFNNLVLGKVSGNNNCFAAAIEIYSDNGFTIQQAAEIQKEMKDSDDNAFFLKKKQMVVLPFIQSLHQLQNLYFALTGKELVYQPTPQPA